jgi:hypothetical protein
MTHEEKAKLINDKIKDGDKRSYNEIQADLELELWTQRMKGPKWIQDIKNSIVGK